MKKDILVPSVGESVNEADIEKWEKQTGDTVRKGEAVALLETDKASLEVSAEQDGKLTVLKPAGSTVSIGEAIGYIEPLLAGSQPEATNSPQKSPDRTEGVDSSSQKLTGRAENTADDKASTAEKQDTTAKTPPTGQNLLSLSPAVRRLVGEHKLDPQTLSGTGKGGRLTKEDILKALSAPQSPPASSLDLEKKPPSGPPSESSFLKPGEKERLPSFPPETALLLKTEKGEKTNGPSTAKTVPDFQAEQYREPMSRLRKRTAERLLHSSQSTAALSTFNEVDMSNIIHLRKKYQEMFVKKHGVKLGFMSFFVKAVVSALKEYPRVNAFIEETDIVYNRSCHIGIAVSTESGLVVPVIHGAEKLTFSQIEERIIQYSAQAKNRKLTLDDLTGGTFTISNGGVFGSLLSTPILNPPQSGILGMHKIEQRPVALAGRVVIRPMMYLTLSYDHRIIDGRESVGFLMKIKEYVEDPARILIDA